MVSQQPIGGEAPLVAGFEVGDRLTVNVEEVFDGGVVVNSEALGMRGALLRPAGLPVVVSPEKCRGGSLPYAHDHCYYHLQDYGRKKQKKFAKKACQQSAARPHDMVSCRRNLNNGGVIHDFSNGNSLKQNSDISTQRLGVDPNPDTFSVTITTEGRKAKSSAAEKMALCAEYYKLPHERYRGRKAVKKSSQSHQNPNTVKLNSSVNQSRAVVGATNMKVTLTSCVTPMVKQGKALVNAHLSNSYPQVQGTKTVPSTTCKKKLDFLQPSALLPVNGQHPNDTFTASSSSPRSSPLLLPSPPQSHEPLLTQYTSSDTISSEQSEVEIIDVEGTSSVVAYKPVLKEFSIPLARITYQTI